MPKPKIKKKYTLKGSPINWQGQGSYRLDKDGVWQPETIFNIRLTPSKFRVELWYALKEQLVEVTNA